MDMEAKLMSECGEQYIVDNTEGEGDRYQVDITSSDYLVVCMGFTFDKAAANFNHPNMVSSRKVVHEFKHYWQNGRKFWTAKAGVDHYMVIPKTAITMLPEKGYSYVPVMINGVKVKFSVTGGTMNGWTDYVSQFVHTNVNYKLADLKKILEVAVRGTSLEPIPFKDQDESEIQSWDIIVGERKAKLKLIDMIVKGEKPVLKLKTRYSYRGLNQGTVIKLERVGRWNKNGKAGDPCFTYTGAPKAVRMTFDQYTEDVRVKVSQVDWLKSAKALAVAI